MKNNASLKKLFFIVLFILNIFTSNNTIAQITLPANSLNTTNTSLKDSTVVSSIPNFFEEISKNEYNFFYIISLEGCINCTYAKMGAVRGRMKDKITKDNEFLIVNNFLNSKTKKKLEHDLKIKNILDKRDTAITSYLDININPSIIILDNMGFTLLNESLYKLNDNINSLNQFFKNTNPLVFSKQSGTLLKGGDTNISLINKIYLNNKNNKFYLLDGFNFNIQKYDLMTGDISHIYEVPNKILDYYKLRDTLNKKYWDNLPSTFDPSFVNFLIFNDRDDSLLVFLTLPKINNVIKSISASNDTNVTLNISFIDIATWHGKDTNQTNEIFELHLDSNNAYSAYYNEILSYNNSLYILGRFSDCSAEKCRNLEGEKGAIFFKFDPFKEKCEVLLKIDDIRRNTKKDFNPFYGSSIYNNNQGDFVLFSSMNATFLTFQIEQNKVGRIQVIKPQGILHQILREFEVVIGPIKDFMKEYTSIKPHTIYYFSDLAMDNDRIYVLLKQDESNTIKTNDTINAMSPFAMQIYSLKGDFISEMSITMPQSDKIANMKLIGTLDNKLYFLVNWDTGEYMVHSVDIKTIE